jgi:AraC-like DNA-binding protein
MKESFPERSIDLWSDVRICAAMSFMRNNLSQEISLDDIAREIHLSTSRFKHLFVTVTGSSPKSHLRMMRMELASELLRDRSLQIKEIAAEVGMPSVGAFSRNFRAAHGVSPQAYRQRVCGAPRQAAAMVA